MKSLGSLVMLAFLVLVAACDSRSLSRDEALQELKKLARDKPMFRSGQRAALAREITLNASACPAQPSLADDFGYIHDGEKNALRNAVATGVIANFIFAGRKSGWSGPYCSYIMQFGKAAMPYVPNDHFVFLESFDPVEVTGLKEVSDRVRLAEVRFRTVPTPFAELGLHPVDPASPLQGTATFVKYDDGWRIEKVE